MSYQRSLVRTGTAQDLFSLVVSANERFLKEAGTELPIKTPLIRALLEPLLLAIGLCLAEILKRLEPEKALKHHDKLFRFLARPYYYAFDSDAPVLEQARELTHKAAHGGKSPTVLALISHPPVHGDLAHMNLELGRHALLALRAVSGAPCRPHLVVAVDPFALDTLSIMQEGLYAGIMGSYHLGIDRMALGRGMAARALLAEAAWTRMPTRLVKCMNAGQPVGMVLAGGVPSTARPMYALREWLMLWRRRSPLRGDPAEVLRRLRLLAGFQRFENEWPHGACLGRSAWKMMEAWAMSALEDVQEPSASVARTGRLDGRAHDIIDSCLEAVGLEVNDRITALAALRGTLMRQTPLRGRFFRVLADRVLTTGRPIIFIPVVHHIAAGMRRIAIKPAWAWVRGDAQKLEGLRAGKKITSWEGSAGSFASAFVSENFA